MLVFLGCETESKLTFENHVLAGETCTTCAVITIEVPQALDDLKIANTINTSIDEELIYTLKFEEEAEVNTVTDAISSFNNSYQSMVTAFGETAEPWEASVKGNITFENAKLISLALENYTYTGGAHGYFSKVFLNFDKNKGAELEGFEFFKDMVGFLTLAERKFREEHGIPATGNINATGFMFSGDTFHLAENFGFTADGIQLHYNQYEVASYADGPLVLTISYQDANPFLTDTYKVKVN